MPTNRQELGGSRPPSRLHGFGNNDYGRSANPPPSGAVRPPGKRVFEPDIDEEPKGPAHGQGGSSLYPQLEAKRRRTDDEEFLEVVVRPTMLPPKRQSNARKVRKINQVVIDREDLRLTFWSRTARNNPSLATDMHPRILITNLHLY